MTYTLYCPNCDTRITVEEEGAHYRLTDGNGHTITTCPGCMIELELEGGVLVESK